MGRMSDIHVKCYTRKAQGTQAGRGHRDSRQLVSLNPKDDTGMEKDEICQQQSVETETKLVHT